MPEMKSLECLVVDDEPPAREIIKRYIHALPSLHFAGECANAIQAITFLQRQPIDILFLDIRMPQLNGLDLIKTIKNPPNVIITTAYQEYALEGYELDVVDFLMKPILFERFLKAVNKILYDRNTLAEIPKMDTEKVSEPFIYFRADRKMVKVMLDQILYIESMKDYIKIYSLGETIVTKQSIRSLEELLPETKFVRSHRSFIVSLSKVKSFSSESIEIGNKKIPIGKLYKNNVLKLLNQ